MDSAASSRRSYRRSATGPQSRRIPGGPRVTVLCHRGLSAATGRSRCCARSTSKARRKVTVILGATRRQTTTMRALCRNDPATGRDRVRRQSILKAPGRDRPLGRPGAAGPAGFHDLSVADNMRPAGPVGRVAMRHDIASGDTRSHAYVAPRAEGRHVSGGEQKMLAIARAFGAPRLRCAEPSSPMAP